MKRIALTVSLGPAETATGFAARLGARNGSHHVQDFVQDMGLDWRKIVTGEAQTLFDLAQLSGVPEHQLMHQAIRAGNSRTRLIGSETLPLRVLRVIRQHVCPLCLVEPGSIAPSTPVFWQLKPIRSCFSHGVALMELPPPNMHVVHMISPGGSSITNP